MSNTEIIIRTNNTFKSKELTKATCGLADCFNSANKAYKDACIILAKVEANKAYKEDGFASLAEYAELIGLNKSAAHKMENAGRLILSENPVIRDFAAKADYSKLSLLASEDEDEVAEAVEKGELTADSTAANVKAWKAARPVKEGKEKIVPTFHIVGIAFTKAAANAANAGIVPIDVTIGIDSPANWAREYDNTALVSSVKDNDGTVHYVAMTADGSMFNYTAERVKTEKKTKKAAPVAFDLSKLPDEIVAKMIAEYNAKREGK